MALGADAGRVRRLVLKQGLSVVALGAIAGGAVALGGAGLLRSLLFEVPPRDPAIMAAAFGLVGAAASVALLVPAMRAASANAADVLREG